MTQLPEHRRTQRKLDHLEHSLRQQGAVISCIHSLTGFLMADNAAALATIAELRQAIVDDQTSDQAIVTALDAALDAAIVNADTQPLINAINEAKSQIVPVTSTH